MFVLHLEYAFCKLKAWLGKIQAKGAAQRPQELIDELDQFAPEHASHVEWFSPSTR